VVRRAPRDSTLAPGRDRNIIDRIITTPACHGYRMHPRYVHDNVDALQPAMGNHLADPTGPEFNCGYCLRYRENRGEHGDR
jgi:hypothetical protein